MDGGQVGRIKSESLHVAGSMGIVGVGVVPPVAVPAVAVPPVSSPPVAVPALPSPAVAVPPLAEFARPLSLFFFLFWLPENLAEVQATMAMDSRVNSKREAALTLDSWMLVFMEPALD